MKIPQKVNLLHPSWRHQNGALPACPSPPLARGHLGQGWFIDTALRSLPLPEETAPGGDGPDLAVLVDNPFGTAQSGNRRLPGVPPARGAGQGHPCCPQPGARGGTKNEDGTAQLHPLLGPRHLRVGWEWVCPPLRALPASLMGCSCFSQRW